MKKALIIFLFRFSCVCLFLYQSLMLWNEFSLKSTVSKTFKESHQNVQFPHFCVTTSLFNDHNFNNSLNLTHDDYVSGRWRTEDMTEEELFEFLAMDLHELVDKIKIRKTVNSLGDYYKSHSVKVTKDTNFAEHGLKLYRKDYYKSKHVFCLELQFDHFPYGIQYIKFYLKTLITVYIINPGSFYDRGRKLNALVLDNTRDYGYKIRYSIFTKLKKDENTCKEELNWKVDDCKMKQLTQRLVSQFNCTAPWLAYFSRKHIHQNIDICDPTKSSAAAEFYYRSRYDDYSQCQVACTEITVDSSYVYNVHKKGRSAVELIIPKTVDVTEETLKKPVISAIAEAGGYLGMILGVSLMDLQHLFCYLNSCVSSYRH